MSPSSLRLLIPAHLEQLVDIHQEILTKLKQHMAPDSERHGLVGEIFSDLCMQSEVCLKKVVPPALPTCMRANLQCGHLESVALPNNLFVLHFYSFDFTLSV